MFGSADAALKDAEDQAPAAPRRDWSRVPDSELAGLLAQAQEELQALRDEIAQTTATVDSARLKKRALDGELTKANLDFTDIILPPEVMDAARDWLRQCSQPGAVVSYQAPMWKGYACDPPKGLLDSYFGYTAHGLCPDDWLMTQDLIFVHNCFALPKRDCLSRTPPQPEEPVPFPQSLFSQSALKDANVRWDLHHCKSYECLNTRVLGDCQNCFNMHLEGNRWRTGYRGSLPIRDVVALKNGSLRLGLDVGGGSGSFAAHMALHGVTVMTTAMNLETVPGRTQGLPYMETIAQRGLVALHLPHKARLPFFDNTLDLVHCVNSVKFLALLEFEELLFEWDRVLRPGGIMWFEMFYAQRKVMPLHVALIEQLGYKKLHWNMLLKPGHGERRGQNVYLNCVIEKPVRPDPKGWLGMF